LPRKLGQKLHCIASQLSPRLDGARNRQTAFCKSALNTAENFSLRNRAKVAYDTAEPKKTRQRLENSKLGQQQQTFGVLKQTLISKQGKPQQADAARQVCPAFFDRRKSSLIYEGTFNASVGSIQSSSRVVQQQQFKHSILKPRDDVVKPQEATIASNESFANPLNKSKTLSRCQSSSQNRSRKNLANGKAHLVNSTQANKRFRDSAEITSEQGDQSAVLTILELQS